MVGDSLPGWVRGDFEGEYEGGRTGEELGASRSYAFTVLRGTLRRAARVQGPPPVDTLACPVTQNRIEPVLIEVGSASAPVFHETPLLDCILVTPSVSFAAEGEGRSLGTLRGTLYGRVPIEDAEEPSTVPPLEASSPSGGESAQSSGVQTHGPGALNGALFTLLLASPLSCFLLTGIPSFALVWVLLTAVAGLVLMGSARGRSAAWPGTALAALGRRGLLALCLALAVLVVLWWPVVDGQSWLGALLSSARERVEERRAHDDGARDVSAGTTAPARRISLDDALRDPEAFFQTCTRNPVYLTGDLLFETGQDTLRPEALPHLRKLARLAALRPHARIVVEGHADSTGDPAFNGPLSERRAASVRSFLLSSKVGSDRKSVV